MEVEWNLHHDPTVKKPLGEAFSQYWKLHPEQTKWIDGKPPTMPGYTGNGEIDFNKSNAIALTEMFREAIKNGTTITNDDIHKRFGVSRGIRF